MVILPSKGTELDQRVEGSIQMRTDVISIINFKGGVGKTTVTLNLGYELSKKDKVLLIDFDGQGNLSKFAGAVQDGRNLITVLNKLIEGEKITEHPIQQIRKNLDIMTCNITKEQWINRILPEIARETILKRYIDLIKRECNYRYILIDNAPSVNLDFQNALVGSDYYLIITEPELGSTDGIKTVESIIAQMQKYYNPSLSSAGIVINKAESRTNLHNMMEEAINDAWGDELHIYNEILPRSIVAGESNLLCKCIAEHEPKSKLAFSFNRLADEFRQVLEEKGE